MHEVERLSEWTKRGVSRLGEFTSKVGNLIMEHPTGSLGVALITAAFVQGGVIGMEAWGEAGLDVERKAAE